MCSFILFLILVDIIAQFHSMEKFVYSFLKISVYHCAVSFFSFAYLNVLEYLLFCWFFHLSNIIFKIKCQSNLFILLVISNFPSTIILKFTMISTKRHVDTHCLHQTIYYSVRCLCKWVWTFSFSSPFFFDYQLSPSQFFCCITIKTF